MADPWTPAGHAALGRAPLDEVRRLERLGVRAWPPLETASLGGWVLRAAGSGGRRLNSAWPLAAHTLTVDQLLRATTAWYAARGLPPRLQLSPANAPADLADHLADFGADLGADLGAGWTVDGETLVLSGPLDGGSADDGVEVSAYPTEQWLAVASEVFPTHFGAGSAGTTVLQRLSLTTGYAVAREAGQPVAVGRAVVDGADVGLFSTGTLPDARRSGHARRVSAALQRWAAGHGAARVWLQVEAENGPALALHGGLEPVFSYAYSTGPAQDL